MINITCATREDMESSLQQMIVRCVAAYKQHVITAIKIEHGLEPHIEQILNKAERDLHECLKVEVSGTNERLNELIDGQVSH